jgi:hypothetical protein
LRGLCSFSNYRILPPPPLVFIVYLLKQPLCAFTPLIVPFKLFDTAKLFKWHACGNDDEIKKTAWRGWSLPSYSRSIEFHFNDQLIGNIKVDTFFSDSFQFFGSTFYDL